VATTLTPALQPYLPRLVVEWQESDPGTRFREIDGSMVFVDVSGFTKMSERLARQGRVGAEEVSDVIDDTFSSLLARAYAYGGGLLKFGGDALLLFFDGDGHPLRATAAAHGMRAELRRIGTFTTTAGKVTLRMSVGVHTGLFHFFLVGDSHRELIVAGPAATETVTMEGAASAGQILLSPALAAVLPGANRGRELGPGVLLAGTPPEVETVAIERVSTRLDLTPLVAKGLRETVQQGEVEPEHRTVTIAFVHYGGFDEMVLRDGPAAAADALDGLVRSAQRAVDERGVAFLSTDVAPDGGKIILTAGAPTVTGADEEGMLLAVREIVAADTPLPLHVGVNTGPVFAGTIGPAYRKTYTVMGDAVNLAARLMAKAEHGQVVATPIVLDGSRTLFETEELEPFLVKGKKQPITAFVVGEAKGSRASIAESGLPLVGRDEELAVLTDAWARAARGEGVVVEITAEPGMGKTRLLDEFLGRIGDADLVRGECRLYQAATPYFPFRTLLQQAFGLEGLEPDEAPAALAALVAERSPALAPWLSLIGTPLDLEIEPSPEVRELEDEFRRARLEQAVDGLLAEVVTEPTVLLVEDAHWMDEPSRDLLARLASAAGTRPWLVLLARRPGPQGYVASEEDATRIELGPLDPDAAAALIDAATEHDPLMPRQVRALAERAAGNPLFLLELLDALRRGEDVEALPQSVDGLIQARIDRLPPADRTRLRELSVLGTTFREEYVVSALARGRRSRVREGLNRLGAFVAV
jgi:class 3 adenylate cyclase